jgi:hypothetical protein
VTTNKTKQVITIKNMKTKLLLAALAIVVGFFASPQPAAAQGTAFTYQGQLQNNGIPANGLYDFRFNIIDAPGGGTVLAPTQITNAIAVSNGLFAVSIDFGQAVFTGPARWLEITVSSNNANNFFTLGPRQQLTPTPYAIYAQNAGTASIASGFSSSAVIQARSLDVGWSNNLGGIYPTISGGVSNNASGNYAVIAGGFGNTASTNSAAVGGGSSNLASGDHSFVGGGFNNTASGTGSFVGGGAGTTTADPPIFIGGNLASGISSMIGGGVSNTASGAASTIGGGVVNKSTGGYSFIGGGALNNSTGYYSCVAGGSENNANETASFVGAGANNTANAYDVIGGGSGNVVNGQMSTIGGGELNVVGFYYNDGYSLFSTISGGFSNFVSAAYGTVPGGDQNVAGQSCFSAGHRAKAMHIGSFVWADSTDLDFSDTANNQFLIRASGGVVMQTSSLRFLGAGADTSTPVFTHKATSANVSGNKTYINNPVCNGQPNAILIITENWSASDNVGNSKVVGVYYDAGAGQWTIFVDDGTAMPVGVAYNVMVTSP